MTLYSYTDFFEFVDETHFKDLETGIIHEIETELKIKGDGQNDILQKNSS